MFYYSEVQDAEKCIREIFLDQDSDEDEYDESALTFIASGIILIFS